MRLTTETVEFIKASQGLYRASDVARHYGVHRSTVTRIWDGAVHSSVSPAVEPPNVISRPRPSELAEDIRLLLGRGMTPVEVAEALGVSVASVYVQRGVFV